ncbi:MAG: trehalose-phosphatase [Stappia sp.]|uniref:trehalose-phosphatase n=1 Tax=Stappia sp. TaxID=1870903 RepID=UPI000C368B19|nr:trehalose-phosphatase [Stappia sp.]MAA97822.1 trehalose-phosphatase [Stappia sp.]MBM21502.1 trehalose-phosphatase [Stappia sp.]
MNAPPPVADDFALFLDFDGTLVEIAPTPTSIDIAPSLAGHLKRLERRLAGALALVSGRSIRELDDFLDPLDLPAAGLHGLETRFRAGEPAEPAPVGPEIAMLKEALSGSGLLSRGVTLEDKGAALAVHYRIAPDCEEAVMEVMRQVLEGLPDLHLVRGKMVVEAKPAYRDKGWAVSRFMEMDPFRGRTPVFVGDDVTDEDGIRMAQALGGFGIKIGDGHSEARFRLAGVKEVHAWLEETVSARARPPSRTTTPRSDSE